MIIRQNIINEQLERKIHLQKLIAEKQQKIIDKAEKIYLHNESYNDSSITSGIHYGLQKNECFIIKVAEIFPTSTYDPIIKSEIEENYHTPLKDRVWYNWQKSAVLFQDGHYMASGNHDLGVKGWKFGDNIKVCVEQKPFTAIYTTIYMAENTSNGYTWEVTPIDGFLR